MLKNNGFSLRVFIFFFMTFVLLISIPGTGYFMMKSAKDALIEEKQSKLFALAKLMDEGLETTFDEILTSNKMGQASREEKIWFLNGKLKKYTDMVAGSETGIGVGYYSKSLDSIVTYGPSSDLGQKVGQTISPDHLGHEVMRTGKKIVQTASLVRGKIMNCMYPIERGGKVIGYIWANELVEDINFQIERMKDHFYIVILFGVLISIAVTSLVANYIAAKVTIIKNGLKNIQGDLNYRIEPISGEFGEIGKAINEMADSLSERKKLELQMQRADRLAALGEVAAGVAHEVKNPITAVKGFIQLIEEDIPEGDSRREYTGIAVSEINRIDKIVEQLLYYARPSDSRKILADINHVLKGVLPLVSFRIQKGDIKLITDFKENIPLIMVDEEQIKQVFLNLIINSTQAMEKGDEISISTGINSSDDFLKIEIRDTGVGIAKDDLNKLFNPFFTTRSDGTGLGLAVSQRIIELHNGEIKVWSEPGKGTIFTVYLPIADTET